MKERKYIIIVAIFLLSQKTWSQTSIDIVGRYELDTASAFAEIRDKISQCNMLCGSEDVRIYPIYLFVDTAVYEHERSSYLNHTFLDGLIPHYFHPKIRNNRYVNRNKWWRFFHKYSEDEDNPYWIYDTSKLFLKLGRIVLADTNNCFIGYVDCNNFALYPTFQPDLIDSIPNIGAIAFLVSGVVDVVFDIQESERKTDNRNRFLYAINFSSNEVYIIVETIYGSDLFLLSDIVHDYWEDFQQGLPKLYEEVRQRKKNDYDSYDTK